MIRCIIWPTMTRNHLAQLRHCLDILQRMWFKPKTVLLVTENADWYVIMCVLIREGYLQRTSKRPPYINFIKLLRELEVPLYITRPNKDILYRTNMRAGSIHSPWLHNQGTHPNRIPRWKAIDKTLVQLLHKHCPIV